MTLDSPVILIESVFTGNMAAYIIMTFCMKINYQFTKMSVNHTDMRHIINYTLNETVMVNI